MWRKGVFVMTIQRKNIIRFSFDSADDLYLIGENLITTEKEKRGADKWKVKEEIK